MRITFPIRWPDAIRGSVLAAVLVLHAVAFAAKQGEERTLPDFDKRRPAEVEIVTAEKGLATARLRERLRGVRVQTAAVSEAPQFVGSPDEFLSGPDGEGRAVPSARARALQKGEPNREVRAFLDEYKGLYGHGAEALATAQVKRDYTNVHNGLRSVIWQQQVDGVPVFGAMLQAHITRRGELVNVASHFLPDPVAAANRGGGARAALLAAPAISAREAVAIAGRNIGETVQAADITTNDAPLGAEKKQGFRAAGLRGASAHFAWLPMDKGSARLCWEVVLTGRASGEMFRILVDATTGEPHIRHCLTNYISEATYRVFTGDSPTPMQPSLATPSTAQPPEVARTLVTLTALNTTASPNGWIDDGVNETRGNNVDAHLDLDGNNIADLPRPQGSPFRVFDFPLDLTQAPSAYRNAAVTQLFYWCNWMHDKLYALGFNEAAGNFQNNNFGRGGAGNDAVEADAQDGSGTNNANFSTPGDGSPGRMQMYVFTGPTPARDGDLDAAIILHEYAHGLSNRLVGGGAGISANASIGMGEGWSDFYAIALLSKPGDDPNGNYAVGSYATLQFSGLTENYYYGIRRYPYSTDLTKNPLTFKDIDPARAGSHPGIPRNPVIGTSASESHNVGEVWCMALWEARANLIARHGFATGNQLMLQLVTDGMKLSPANPNFLQARDAILQADLVNNAGANKDDLWAAFAKRGMGASATAPASSTTTGVFEAFDLPDDLAVTPATTSISSGPVGGPFTVTTTTYTLRNIGPAPLNWTAAKTAAWLDLSAAGGTLAPGATTTVTATLNASALGLAAAIYADSVTFSNLTSARSLTRGISLFIGQPDYFTELFDTSSPNDTAFQTFTFTPHASANLYYVTRKPATAFPSDTTVASLAVTLGDDASALVTLANSQSVKIYGTSYTNFYVGSNGYITFGSGDIEWVESYDAHFLKPRISALFRDLNPAVRGTIRRKQFADRIAVTWLGVPEYGTLNSNNFQIELFFDGRISITLLGVASTKGLIGLARGLGVPAGFVKSNFSNYPPPTTLSVALPASAMEGAGVLAGQGSVTLSHPWATDLTVTLTSGDPAAVTVPASVIVPAGQTSTLFSPTILDDGIINGTRTVTITATTTGWTAGSRAISILDNENTNLVVTLADVTEGATSAGTVSLSGTLPSDLAVSLSSGNPARLTVPASMTIPAGSTSGTFMGTAVQNTVPDGNASVTVTASAAGFTAGTATATVFDDDPHHLAFSTLAGSQIRGAPFSVTITAVDINGVAFPNFSGTVNLTASNGVTVTPGSVVLAGGSATVDVTANVFGTGVMLTASDSAALSGMSTAFNVTHGPLDHFEWLPVGASRFVSTAFPVTIVARDVVGNTVADFVGAPALNCGTATNRTVPLSPSSTTAFSAGVWSGNLAVGQIISGITLRAFLGAATGDSGVFNVIAQPGATIVVTSPPVTTQSLVTITGLASDPAGIAALTVNGAPASTTDGFAHWTLPGFAPAAGSNALVIQAVNNSFAPLSTTLTSNLYRATMTADFDHDGLPDAWESLAGLDLFDSAGSNGALGDLSGNGVPNLLKYAFNLDPLSTDITGLPVTSIETDSLDHARYLTLRYRRLLAPGPLQYLIEVTPDLLDWTSTPADFDELAPTVPNGDGLTETVSIRVKPALGTPGAPIRCVRVRILVP